MKSDNPTYNITWKQLPNEPNECYEAFRYYLDLGITRKFSKLQETGRFPDRITVYRWAKRWHWKDRIANYNEQTNYIPKEKAKTRLQEIRDQILTDAQNDYDTVHSLWLNMIQDFEQRLGSDNPEIKPKPQELKAIIDARKHLDDFARRSAVMPTNYGSSKATDDSDEGATTNLEYGEALQVDYSKKETDLD